MPAQLQVYWLTVYKSSEKCVDKEGTSPGDYLMGKA